MTRVLLCLFLVLSFPAHSAKKDNSSLIRGLISAYYPNLTLLADQKALSKAALQKKIKKAKFDGKNKFEYITKNGKSSFWLSKKGKLSSARLSFKVNEKELSNSERDLLLKNYRKIKSLSSRQSPHSNISQIKNKKEKFTFSVFHHNSDAKGPRIVELFLAEGFFK